MRAYVQVTRADRPIGTALLLWPTLVALWIAAEGWPGWHLFLVFAIGTFLTRSAGCVLNDLTDMKFDGHVKRTSQRPLVTGELDPVEAMFLAGAIMFVALCIVLTTNVLTVGLAVIAVIITATYPFMKRVTYLPQAVLGLAFSMGIVMAFSAVSSSVPNVAWLLLIANLLWVVAYDTEYAMVDRDDDLRIGVKSTAILFGDMDKLIIGALQASTIFIWYLVGEELELGVYWLLGMTAATGLFIYQQFLIRHRSRDGCFQAFLNNHWAGLCLFVGTATHYLFI